MSGTAGGLAEKFMHDFLQTPVFFLSVTIILYAGASNVHARLRWVILQPVLVCTGLVILLLVLFRIDYETYMKGGQIIHFFLGPAVVALSVPLYIRFRELKSESPAILFSLTFGSLVGIVSAVIPLMLLGIPDEIIRSFAPKSVTTPIAMGIAENIGGIPSLTAAVVVVTGITGAVIGPMVLKLCGIVSGTPYGLAMGAAAHGIGTAGALEQGELEGASSSLAICLNGILTALLTPLLIRLLG